MTALFSVYKNLHQIKKRETEFISTVTHELCTPIAVIHSAGENLKAGVVKKSSKMTEYGNIICEESKRLQNMVEKLLVYSGMKTKRNTMNGQSVIVEQLLEQVLTSFNLALKKHQIKLHLDIEKNLPVLSIDEEDFFSILQNLISNVIKHASSGHFLGISIYMKIGIGEIGDGGKGISKKEQKYIFTSFYRTKETINQQVAGSGFGLFLVKKIVIKYKGNIKVISSTGQGSKFIIYLPY